VTKIHFADEVIYDIQACNDENDVLQGEFDLVKNNLYILESHLQTEKQRIDSEVSGVGSQMNLHQAILHEVRLGIGILQYSDNQIVKDALSMISGINAELQASSKTITENTIQILAVKGKMNSTQMGMKYLASKVDSVNKILSSITKSLAEIPSKKELNNHPSSTADQVAQIQEVNTGLTTAMEGYKFSESSRFDFRGNTVPLGQAGPSGFLHPQRQGNVNRNESEYSLTDTHSASTWLGTIRGGDGSDHNSQDGAASGAAGGATGANGDPPPDPPPSDCGDLACRISR